MGLAFSSPFLIGLVVFTLYPTGASAYYSFTDFNLFQPPRWVGLDNYQAMLHDERLGKAIVNTLYITILGVPLSIVLALAGAHVLNWPIKGLPLYRALCYLPTIMPIVVGGYLWRWILNAQYGALNQVLGWVGIPGPVWLESPDWSRPAIIMMSLWTVGGMMIIYLAALKDVPRDLHEAAALDGANAWGRFLHVTWPYLTPVTLFQLITQIIAYVQIFTQPYLLTQARLNPGGGGPDDTMLSYTMYLFTNAFTFYKMGYASTLAWALFLATLVITAVVMLTSNKWVHYGA